MRDRDAPIGVFDSGLGGLTVVRQIRTFLPAEPVLYVADQAHVPYGGRPLVEVRQFALGISRALYAAGCKAIVMACNISSATALDTVRQEYPDMPVLGVIGPGVRVAVRCTRNRRIGVLATEGTVRSQAYRRALQACNPDLEVVEVACPAFVPLVEAGALDTPETVQAAVQYLSPLCMAGVDTVILGCTHYPFLLPVLQRIAPQLTFVDPARATVERLLHALLQRRLHAPLRTQADLLVTTGNPDAFRRQTALFFPDGDWQIASACWSSDGTLTLPERSSFGTPCPLLCPPF
ncbi:MAG: glutamate racemase [Chloroherpetonaceae bacterium]|nr:glutamate racemase [Chthonomonadaceae bacterium]MDW8207493.1 glutamate racemase [Chloroherpetonaceae bacterium]